MTGTHERHTSTTGVTEETRIAFGKFVNLMRRRFGFSVERLAEEADLDASELLIIEGDRKGKYYVYAEPTASGRFYPYRDHRGTRLECDGGCQNHWRCALDVI